MTGIRPLELVVTETEFVYRILVFNGRDEPFALRWGDRYPKNSACQRAASAIEESDEVRFLLGDRYGLYWHSRVNAEIAARVARKAIEQ